MAVNVGDLRRPLLRTIAQLTLRYALFYEMNRSQLSADADSVIPDGSETFK